MCVQEVDLSNNKLSGTLPLSLGFCQDLRSMDLSNNTIEGSLPTFAATDRLQVGSCNFSVCMVTQMCTSWADTHMLLLCR